MQNTTDQAASSPVKRTPRGRDRINRAKSRRLEAKEFDAVTPFLRISPERIAAAREAMVEGKKQIDIAESYGWKSKQAVDSAVGKVWTMYKKLLESREIVASDENQ